MKTELERQLEQIEAIGDDHIGTSAVTPLRADAFEMSNADKLASIQKDVAHIMETLGLDMTDDSLSRAHVAYISNGTVVGLSKMNRIVDYYAKRPQVQERLTMQIVQELQRAMGTEDVACVIDAKHLCVNSRGIRDIESSTVTSEFGGKFKEEATRREFLDYIKLDTDF